MSGSYKYDDQASVVIQQSISIRDRIIFDDESTETLIYMVNCAKNVLKPNYNYMIVRRMMHELINVMEEEEFLTPYFLCGLDEEKVDPKQREALVDRCIEELLRFLAMRILLATGESKREIDRYDCGGDDDDSYVEKMRFKFYQLNPSILIRESWKALLLLPHTYADVCKALGISSPIDYDDDEDIGFNGEASTSKWGRECYRWTLQTYANLYVVGPPKTFWPELESHKPNTSLVTTLMTKVAAALQNMDRKNIEHFKKAKKNATGI